MVSTTHVFGCSYTHLNALQMTDNESMWVSPYCDFLVDVGHEGDFYSVKCYCHIVRRSLCMWTRMKWPTYHKIFKTYMQQPLWGTRYVWEQKLRRWEVEFKKLEKFATKVDFDSTQCRQSKHDFKAFCNEWKFLHDTHWRHLTTLHWIPPYPIYFQEISSY